MCRFTIIPSQVVGKSERKSSPRNVNIQPHDTLGCPRTNPLIVREIQIVKGSHVVREIQIIWGYMVLETYRLLW